MLLHLFCFQLKNKKALRKTFFLVVPEVLMTGLVWMLSEFVSQELLLFREKKPRSSQIKSCAKCDI